jgi:hypothetical protein
LCTLVSILGFSSSKHRVAEARMRHPRISEHPVICRESARKGRV